MTIAKFSAARLLVGRVLESAEIDVEARLTLHAETAWRMLSRNDAHTNIVRTNSAALAAGLGGADSLTVLPFDSPLHLPDRLARRVARNSQTILLHEARLALVADPGAGAGAVEALTDQLAEKAWVHFQAIEGEGGLLASLRAGTLQRAIAEKREKRRYRLMRRALPLTGVTSYPAITTAVEISPAVNQDPAAAPPLSETIEALVVSRLAEPFEALREHADRLARSGRRPAVFLAILGRPTDTAAVASEVRQFFASGGLSAVTSAAPISPDTAGAAFGESRAEAACICATAKSSGAEIAAAARALKAEGATAIGVAGHAGAVPFTFDYRIERDTDVVALLSDILERIAVGRMESPRAQ
jgi:methylmalonyl-CoA mutase